MINCKITIIENGPYWVQGNVPLEERFIIDTGIGYQYASGQDLPQAQEYKLCRCGHSGTMPFCDGSHAKARFDGSETASKEPYLNFARKYDGYELMLTDAETLCASGGFCKKEFDDAWKLSSKSAVPALKSEAVHGVCDCPSGRLVLWDKNTGEAIEPNYGPSIVILHDAQRQCEGPVWVRGGIPIVSSDGTVYEIRNRVTLCRCGESTNKPFCDSKHIDAEPSYIKNEEMNGKSESDRPLAASSKR